jgi:mRNA-degrading endonuclease RelE of RelBE toxin-antitoxin system
MSWACKLTADAQRDLSDLLKDIRKRVARILDQMTANPFQGNVKALHGAEWKSIFRRRIGDYRILFAVQPEHETVTVIRILRRSGRTYR